MYERITIIGIGSLGGFFAKSVCSIPTLKVLTLVDPDIVENRNVPISIYRRKDVGKRKVDAMTQILNGAFDEDFEIRKFYIEYVEGLSILPKSDLVIDCRDIICRRRSEIDVRLYISHGYLVIDCQKCVEYNEKQGKYTEDLDSFTIEYAAVGVVRLISSGKIKRLIERQLITTIPLYTSTVDECIENSLITPDIIHDRVEELETIRNINQHIPTLLKQNTKHKIPIIYKSDNEPIKTIPKLFLKNYSQALNYLAVVANEIKLDSNRGDLFTIEVEDYRRRPRVVIIPIDGGA